MKPTSIVCSIFLFFSSFNANAITFDDGDVIECTRIYAPQAVRYWKLYSFYNTWNNDSDSTTYLHKYWVQYKNSRFLGVGKKFKDGSHFSWSSELKKNSYAIPPQSKMKYLETFAEDWGIVQKPEKRADSAKGEHDFIVAYKTSYDKLNNTAMVAKHSIDISCQPYYVTWLGDGIVDERYEKCDPADAMKAGWGKNGCDQQSGTPIN